MADFSYSTPPVAVTNPGASGTAFSEFPKHVYDADGGYIVVRDDVEQSVALEKGYFLTNEAAKVAKKGKK